MSKPAYNQLIDFSASQQTYTVVDKSFEVSFEPTTLVRETDGSHPRVEWQKDMGNGTFRLQVFKSPTQFSANPLKYSSYGSFKAFFANSSNSTNLDYFTYGPVTPATSLPASGIFTYRWSGTGQNAGNERVNPTKGSGEMTVNFATKQVSVDIVVTGNEDFGGTPGTYLTFHIDATIDGSMFKGEANFTDPKALGSVPNSDNYSGTIAGQFYGPSAQEMGFVYIVGGPGIATGSRPTYNGGAVGLRQ